MQATHDLILVGGGIAGSAAALRAAQYGHLKTLWIRGDKATAKRSRAQWVHNIDNMIGLHDGIVRKKLLRRLRGADYAAARELIESAPARHDRDTRDRRQHGRTRGRRLLGHGRDAERGRDWRPGAKAISSASTSMAASFAHPFLVLATGVMDRQPMVKKTKGETLLDDPKWVYPFANAESFLYCIRCEGHLTRDEMTCIIGHGEAAAQLAMMLHERYGSACCIASNGESPVWSERSQRLLEAYGIGVHESRIVDVEGAKGELNAIELEDGSKLVVRFALVSLGLYRVYNDLARELGAELEGGDKPIEEQHVMIAWDGETNVQRLYAIGDMVRRHDGEPVMKQVYTAQEYAVRAVDAIDRSVRADKRRAALGED